MAVLLALLERQQSWGTAHVYDGLRGRMEPVRLPRDPECPNHEGPLPVSASHDASVAQTRAADLEAPLDPSVGLRLRHTLVVELRCECGRRTQVLEPLAALVPEALRCGDCGGERSPESLVTIPSHHPLWDRPFAELGVPPGDVVGLLGESETRWVELAGDLNEEKP